MPGPRLPDRRRATLTTLLLVCTRRGRPIAAPKPSRLLGGGAIGLMTPVFDRV